MDSAIVADALIANRDGIVGNFKKPDPKYIPDQLALESVANMPRWARERREQVVDFELHSRISFTQGTGGSAGIMTVWHLELVPGAGTAAPTANFHPLVSMTRPGLNVFERQLELVANYADLRADRLAEVVTQTDGPGAFLASIAYLAPTRARWTLELLDAVFRLAQFVEFRLKHALACRRPMEYSAQIQPMLLTPEHSSFPSGHSTESFAMALVLIELLRASTNPAYDQDMYACQLLRQAARIAINRQVAGVHFPVDSAAGAFLGLTLGAYFCRRATGASHFDAWGFDGAAYPPDADLDWTQWYDIPTLRQTPTAFAGMLPQGDLGSMSPILEWLWDKALAEWS